MFTISVVKIFDIFQVLAQAAQRGFGLSILGDIRKPSVQGLVQLAVSSPA